MNQPGFDFSPPLARNTDPDTSHAAARRVTTKVDGLESRVVEALRVPGARSGLTAPELAVLLGERDGSISPRMKPLENKFGKGIGLVRRLSERRNGATVWVACPG